MAISSLRAAALVAAGACALAAAAGAEPESPDLSWIDFGQVAAGQTVMRSGRAEGNTVTMDLATRIRAPKEMIFAVLRECEISPQFVPNVVACARIDSINEGRSELFVQTVKPAFFVPRFEHVFRLDYYPYDRVVARRVSGPLARMDGTWWLVDQDDGSVLLVHSLLLQPGFPVPRMFVRATLRRDLPILLNAVRDRAEALARD